MKGFWKKKKVIIPIVVIVVITLVVLITSSIMGGKKKEIGKEAHSNTVQLTKRDLTSSISATGTIESAKVKTVSAKVTNVTVKKVLVEEGDEVTKGQKLLTFDESDLQDALSEAQTNLSDTKTQNNSELTSATRKWKEAKTTYAEQKKKYASSVAKAKEEYEQAKKELATANASEKQKVQETLSQAKKAYEQAKTERDSGNKQNANNVQTAKEQVTTTQQNNKKSLREAQKQVDDAKETLASCSVTAPMSGTITGVAVDNGDTYSGGDIIEISDCTDLQVSTIVDEYDIANVKKGQKVVILTEATDEEELQGMITYVAKTMGSSLESSGASVAGNGAGSTVGSSSSSGNGYEVRISLESENSSLRIGMTAKCSIILEEVTDVFAVPYDAIQKGSDGDVVYVMDDDGARTEVSVTKGMESDYYVQVTGDDLQEGMKIIIPTDATDTADSDSSSKREKSFENFGDKSSGGAPGGMPGGNGGGPGGAPGGN